MDIKRLDSAAIGPVDPNLDAPENSPKNKYSIGLQYEFRAGSGTLTPRVDYSHTGDRRGLGSADFLLEAHDVANVSLTWRSDRDDWEAALNITNATDEWYLHNSFDLSGAGAAWTSAHPAAPRMWSLRLRKFWN
jgi:hypothetical protein